MKILAIDSSGLTSSVAVVDKYDLISEYTVNCKKTHSQTLMPMIYEMNKSIGLELSSLDAIAVSEGPGSFTGLRIGAATAKGLALALNKPIISVPTLDGLAYNIYDNEAIICPIMDAKRNQVYTALYEYEDSKLKKLSESMAVDINEILEVLCGYNRKVIFLGDGVEIYKSLIEESGMANSFAPIHLMKQRASSIGALALDYLSSNNTVSGNDFAPVYLRKSQAEREYEEKIKAGQ
ncbi:tRNA threonylcarbamoyladenosine biosynthesis protein TsaB [Natranaerovirga pectinivora]|uniref:tRNA threonylcarbamoyladenosine biosynthesis protein TsaB n=1 Tax=Natranaerovirga pectinivora TaxID=682400 RepID=A0A4R3MI41_9FIRM|nr:tRNA (adenosine(37)-N6)-threonylcarbamoyltransferase complex dimerization subunit type 1 TsaB [Natranaerovirga pectinivora]TCT13778.1 tRNA threonylcarbamoyladenosine biosynthesis protein TsaB [Natranaerovirga pectinivora]